MNKKALKITGIIAFSFALVANLQFALLNYGLGKNSLGIEVVAQTGTSGGGSSSAPAKKLARPLTCFIVKDGKIIVTQYGNDCIAGGTSCVANPLTDC